MVRRAWDVAFCYQNLLLVRVSILKAILRRLLKLYAGGVSVGIPRGGLVAFSNVFVGMSDGFFDVF